MKNPFVTNGYAGAEYFCDRVKETATLRDLLVNENNVALISPRRLGKTDLIWHLFDNKSIRRSYYCFVVDIYATKNLGDFVNVLGKAVLDELRPKGKKAWEKFITVISSLRSEISFDLNGMPSWNVGLGSIDNPAVTLDEIFTYLNEADKPCIVAIDEFQQIAEYAEKNVEALLRTKIQQCRQAQFIFSGSKRHVMSLMFNSPAKPFYQSAVSMGLEPIPVPIYKDFAIRLFADRNKRIDPEVIETVWQQYEGYTWFVQMMMNELYALTPVGETCRLEQIETAERNIILAQETSYRELLSNLPPRQKTVLQAIAKEGKARMITSQQFIKKYNLGSASSIQSAVKLLLKSDLITQTDGVYRVYDFFFSRWLAIFY